MNMLQGQSCVSQKADLADPEFNVALPVELLIGSELYFDILQQGCVRLGHCLPVLRKSHFGWLLSGIYEQSDSVAHVGFVSNEDLHNNLARFWQIEEESSSNVTMNGSDKLCEEHFVSNVSRKNNGIFEVALPFKSDKKGSLGESFNRAKCRLENLERRFTRDTKLAKAYNEFIQEYIRLGHAELIDLKKVPVGSYFIPHHAVLKDGRYEKIRVVFDASCKTSSGLSLNETLHTGPKLQQDLFSILIRFRFHLYVFVADIVKMYRQIRVREADQYYQLIPWRTSPESEIEVFKLTTVTYGTACAPFLAIRCLKMLTSNENLLYPLELLKS
ncbi:uncharacterized protein LOC113389456 [Ctenocephalides felis]|uniref:uncharacterized protein LOC113389456 n=1 Tax=Ctenocephalides felis TaxID=7515 RepID=UPI000E6E5715|nr:uncharacterized protein LOC113389456 [Ctenocephalides felis]